MSKFLKMQLDLLRAPNFKNLKLRELSKLKTRFHFIFDIESEIQKKSISGNFHYLNNSRITSSFQQKSLKFDVIYF